MNILFDLDGTLTNPREGIIACIKHGLSTLGEPAPPDSELEGFIGPPLRDSFSKLLSGDGARTEMAVQAYRDRFASVGMFENTVYEGIPDALESLRAQGARLYVATSKPHVFAEQILEHFELTRYFQAIFGSELNGTRADKEVLISHVLASARLRPADTIMVGDREHDVRGARRNRVLPIGVLWGYGSRKELMGAGAEQLLEQPRDLGRLSSTHGLHRTAASRNEG